MALEKYIEMIVAGIDTYTITFVLLGALIAGFTTGLAGFGTALVASGLWFHVLPAVMVPPLVALASVVGQSIGLHSVKNAYDGNRARPFFIGGILGVPIGVITLTMISPASLRIIVGGFLITYATFQLLGVPKTRLNLISGWKTDGVVGICGGILGGFAGLSGPVPIIWLQLQGGTSQAQRAIYQPFNLIVLSFAVVGMAFGGFVTKQVMILFALCTPITFLGTLAGLYFYSRMSDKVFRYMILLLLLFSGTWLILQPLLS